MALSNFTNITDAVEDWLNRSGFTAVTNRVEDFVVLAQRRIMRTIRIPPMEVILTLTIDSEGDAVIPDDFLDVKYMTANDGTTSWVVERQPYYRVKGLRLTDGIRSLAFDTEAGSFRFGPAPGSGQTTEVVYYKELEFISTTQPTNWFSTYAPELILWGALTEAAIFLKDFEMVNVYSGKFEQAMGLLDKQKEMSENSSTPLKVRQT